MVIGPVFKLIWLQCQFVVKTGGYVMKRKEFIGKLTYYERLNCSCYGNPRFYGEFTSESGEMLEGKPL